MVSMVLLDGLGLALALVFRVRIRVSITITLSVLHFTHLIYLYSLDGATESFEIFTENDDIISLFSIFVSHC